MLRRPLLLLLAVAVCPTTACRATTLDLVRNGQPRAVIVRGTLCPPAVTNAAEEIQSHVLAMSGAELPIVDPAEAKADAGTAILIGAAADPGLEAAIKQKGTDPDSFALSVGEGKIQIRGLSPEGTRIGAYELLEQLGVRWFIPGDIGTVILKTSDLSVPDQLTVQVPSFNGRWEGGFAKRSAAGKLWEQRLRMGGPYFPAAHGVHLPREGYSFAEHPEYYALIDGERKKRQLCVSNPQVVKGAIETTRQYFRNNPDSPWIGMGPNDGRGFCQCDQCTALDAGDWDPFAAHMSMTDRYVWFFNQILEGISDEFPDKKICFYSYASYNRPPLKYEPNPRIVPAFAPISICRIHGLGNPICPEKDKYQRWLIGEWGKIIPDVYDRGYWFNLADPGLLFPMVHRVRTQIPISHDLGITGWRVETLAHWGSEMPSLYIAAKLMWNHEADVDALMADFTKKYYGPAAEPMGEYFDLINAAVRDADFHTGCSFDIPNLYPANVRAKAKAFLREARGLAGDGVYGTRVQIIQEVVDYTEAFIDMIERRAVHDWKGTAEALARLDAMRERLTAYDPEMITGRYAVSYLKRFFRPCTEQGIERALEKGSLLAGLADEWQFKIDPEGVGESLEWFSRDLTGGNWRPLKTSTLSWSDQGLRYYKNDGWYRQSVMLPEVPEGQTVMLWFGGVDEKAKVWVNGTLLGESPGRAFVPFEIDATDAVLPGKENVVAVRVTNKTLNEVGTGGITAPVMFWTPAETGHKAETGGEDVTPVEFQ